MRPRPQAIDERRLRGGVEIAAEHRIEPLVGKRRLDDQPLDVLDHILEGRGFPAPPGGDRRQAQFLTQQTLGDRRHEPHPRRRFEHPAAERIGDRHLAGADRADQAGHTQRRIGAQFHRIAKIIIEPPQDGVHAAQSAQGLQEQGVAAHRQVMALYQRQPELPGKISVLEVGLVERAGREDDCQRRFALGRVAQQILALRDENAAERPHAEVVVQLRKDARHDVAVLQRIAGSRGGLGAIRQSPPGAVRRARHVDRVDVQPAVAGHGYAVAGPQKIRMSERQLRRHQAGAQQLLRAVQIGEQGIQESGTLLHPEFYLPPLRGGQQQRQRIEHPGAVAALWIGVDIVSHAVLRDQAARQIRAPAHRLGAVTGQSLDQRPPMRAHVAGVIKQLIVATRVARIGVKARFGHRSVCAGRV